MLLLSISFAAWTEADCRKACADADMKFTSWITDSPAEQCDNVQMQGPDGNGLVTYSCEGSDGTDVFVCGCRTQCADGDDNDAGGKTDLDDPGCEDAEDNDETSQCDDGIDNDAGGKVDMDDPGCEDKEDNDETSQCQDKEDNDGDDGIDMGDPGCSDLEDDSEEQKVCKFSILITGGVDDINNDAFFWRETNKKYGMLRGNWKLPAENIYLLYYNGSINRTHDSPNIDGPATLAELEKTFTEIAKKAKECTDRCNNVEITFFAGNHGAADGLNLFGTEKLTPAKLRSYLSKLKKSANSDKMSVWLEMSQCFSGIFSPLSDIVNGVATSVQANNTASYNTVQDRSFQLAFTDALIAGKSWKDAFIHGRDKTREWGWNDTEFPEYGGTGVTCGDGKIAKSTLFGNLKEECDPGSVKTSMCPGEKVCIECQCVEALTYLDCVDEVCILDVAAEAVDDHPLCEGAQEGDPCAATVAEDEENDTDGFVHPYLDCINGLCTWVESPYAMNNHPDCASEGQSCDMDDIGPYEYLGCFEGVCTLVESSTPHEDSEGCVGKVAGDECEVDVETVHLCLTCVDDICVEVEYSQPCEDVPGCSYSGQDCGEEDEIVYEYLGCVNGVCVVRESDIPQDDHPYCSAAGDDCEAPDRDDDGIYDHDDNCPDEPNSAQSDVDGDGLGDVCDPCPFDPYNDIDDDGICGDEDNCEFDYNPDQEDSDGDTIGDVCDECPEDPQNDVDNDGVCVPDDNCEFVANPSQSDLDNDGLGDHCDPDPVDCDDYCGDEGYEELIGEGISEFTCQALGNDYATPDCFTTCAFLHFMEWSWPANSWSCCCRHIDRYACDDCPGENPVCPDPEEVCVYNP